MGQESESNASTDELNARIAVSREHVECNLRGLKYELDFQRKLRRSFQEHTSLWLTGATAAGLLIVLLPMRKKKIYVRRNSDETKHKLAESGLTLGALNIAANLIRPAIVEFVKNRLNRTSRGSRSSGRQ